MEADYLGLIETDLARALRSVDRAAMFAAYLQGHPGLTFHAEGRLAEAVRRAEVIRSALIANGVQLPRLRRVGERDEPPEDLSALTVPQIARQFGLDKSTVVRRLRRLGGKLAARYAAGKRTGEPATFTILEAGQIFTEGEPGPALESESRP